MVVYDEGKCHEEKLVFYLQCQSHSKGIYNPNMTICTISSKLLVATKLDLILQHHKPECSVEKLDYCI